MISRGRRSGLALVTLSAAALMLSACSHGPAHEAANTGEGWAPFHMASLQAGAQVDQFFYKPSAPSKTEWKICAVLAAIDNPLVPVPSTTAAIHYGIADQAHRQHVKVAFYGASTNEAQLARLKSCSKTSDASIVQWVDPSQAGLESLLAQAALGPKPTVPEPFTTTVVGAPGYSYAAQHAAQVVAAPDGLQAIMAAQWTLGVSGGVAGTVVVLPGPAKDEAGNPAPGRALANLVTKTLAGTRLEVVGVYYGPDNLKAQRALVVSAMAAHPGLTYVIGDATATQAAGDIFVTMNTNRRPEAVAMALTPKIHELITSGGVAAAMSGSPVIQGRIALDNAVHDAEGATYLESKVFFFAPIPLPVDATNVATFDEEWWLAPSKAHE
jgi:periplasmic protein TorT